MKVSKEHDGSTVHDECPVYRVRIMSERSDGMLMVSINHQPWNITKMQYRQLEEFMRTW